MTNLNLLLIITTPCCTFSVARACLVISPVQVWISPSGATRFRLKGIGLSPFYTAFHRSQLCNVSSFTTTPRSSSSTLTLFILARFIRVTLVLSRDFVLLFQDVIQRREIALPSFLTLFSVIFETLETH